MPVVAGCAARIRSSSSPQPQPRSSTWWPGEIGSARTRASARSSESGRVERQAGVCEAAEVVTHGLLPPPAARRRAAASGPSWPGSSRQAQLPAELAGAVHPRLRPELEHVLRGHHRERRPRRERHLEERPGRPVGEVTCERVGVVRRRVDDLMHAVVLEPVRVVGRAVERPEQDDHAREAELVAKLVDVRRDHARDPRRSPAARPARARRPGRRRRPGPRAQCPSRAVSAAAGTVQ